MNRKKIEKVNINNINNTVKEIISFIEEDFDYNITMTKIVKRDKLTSSEEAPKWFKEFAERQYAFNAKVEKFMIKQETWNKKQEAWNKKQETWNKKQEKFNANHSH